MWHKAIWKGHPMRLELTRIGLLVELANHYTTRGAFFAAYVCMIYIPMAWDLAYSLEIGHEKKTR